MSKSCNLQIWSYITFTSFLIIDLSFLAMGGWAGGGRLFHSEMRKSNTNTSNFLYLAKNILHTFYFIEYKMHCS